MRYENLIHEAMRKRYGLDFNIIPTAKIKTPDFELIFGGSTVLVAELKTLEDVVPSPESGWQDLSTTEDIEESIRIDNSVAKVGKCIKDAVKQLRIYAGVKMLILYNEGMADVADLDNVLFGYFEADVDGSRHLRFSSDDRPYRNRQADIDEIDIFVWIQKTQPHIDIKTLTIVEEDGLEFYIRVNSQEGLDFYKEYMS